MIKVLRVENHDLGMVDKKRRAISIVEDTFNELAVLRDLSFTHSWDAYFKDIVIPALIKEVQKNTAEKMISRLRGTHDPELLEKVTNSIMSDIMQDKLGVNLNE